MILLGDKMFLSLSFFEVVGWTEFKYFLSFEKGVKGGAGNFNLFHINPYLVTPVICTIVLRCHQYNKVYS